MLHKLFKYGTLIFSVVASAIAYAGEGVTGKLTLVRATTLEHPGSNENQKGIILFQMNTALNQNCPWLFIAGNNDYFASILLSAEARDETIKVWYETTPEGGICRAYTIELQ